MGIPAKPPLVDPPAKVYIEARILAGKVEGSKAMFIRKCSDAFPADVRTMSGTHYPGDDPGDDTVPGTLPVRRLVVLRSTLTARTWYVRRWCCRILFSSDYLEASVLNDAIRCVATQQAAVTRRQPKCHDRLQSSMLRHQRTPMLSRRRCPVDS